MKKTQMGILIVAVVLLLATGIAAHQAFGMVWEQPEQSFADTPPPPAPDYSKPDGWAALPDMKSNVDYVPLVPGEADHQADAKADVFFIHPTTFLDKKAWNARYDEPGKTVDDVDNSIMVNQASAFNGCCRIYAPRYRQAAIADYKSWNASSEAAFDLAYQDVERAFDYYIAHYNKGRPFILASHSQGSGHAMRLIEQRISGTKLAKQLIAAYMIGAGMPKEFAQTSGFPICDAPDQTGCIIDWNSVSKSVAAQPPKDSDNSMAWFGGRYQSIGNRPRVCVNPLNWREDGIAGADLDIGALTPGNPPLAPIPDATDATCGPGGLGVDPHASGAGGFEVIMMRLTGSFHIADYNLYYMNIRKNAEDRVNAYLAALR